MYHSVTKYSDQKLDDLESYKKSLESCRNSSMPNELEIASILHNIGLEYDNKLNDFDQALIYYKEALEIHRKSYPNNPNIAKLITDIGNVYFKQSKYDNALMYYLEYIEMDKQNDSSKDPLLIAKATSNIGVIYYYVNKFEESLKFLEDSNKIYETLLIKSSENPLIQKNIEKNLECIENIKGYLKSCLIIFYFIQNLL